ncbi:MAG: MBL fold metallo-hydrolase [Bacteroidia bacterium]|nr:MBL fold metallo-hydrolase [Bacteroidia bacterium]
MKDQNATVVTFLGTGTSTGVPVVACNCDVCASKDPRDKRLRTSVMVRHKGKTFIIDCGPDFRVQMLNNHVDDIDAILFTHSHRDHIAGLDDVRGFNYILNKRIAMYGQQNVLDFITTSFPYIFANKRYFGTPQVDLIPLDGNPVIIEKVKIVPIKVYHYKEIIFGYRFDDFTYITDASHIDDEEIEKVKGTRILVVNALRNSPHISHFSLQQAIELSKRIHPEQTYFVHMSHFIGKHAELEKNLPAGMHLAYDGLQITLA